MKEIIFSLIIGYVCGCFLTAYFVTKRFIGKDISEIGSGNPGMANVMSNVGRLPGVMVLVGDITKTFLAMGLSYFLFADVIGCNAMLFAGLGTLLGHNFPVWRHFKGGKGVAVTCAWIIIYMPFGGIVSSVAGGIITLLTGLLPFGAVCITLFAMPFSYIEYGMTALIVMIISAVIMLYRNFSGFVRGFQDKEERKFNRIRNSKNTVGTIITVIAVVVLMFIDLKFFAMM